MIKHAFEQLGLNKIIGGTISKEVCILFVKLLKFNQEGVLKDQIFKNNKFNDVYCMGLTKNRYNKEYN